MGKTAALEQGRVGNEGKFREKQNTVCLQGHSVHPSPAYHTAGALTMSVQGLHVRTRDCEQRAVPL